MIDLCDRRGIYRVSPSICDQSFVETVPLCFDYTSCSICATRGTFFKLTPAKSAIISIWIWLVLMPSKPSITAVSRIVDLQIAEFSLRPVG